MKKNKYSDDDSDSDNAHRKPPVRTASRASAYERHDSPRYKQNVSFSVIRKRGD